MAAVEARLAALEGGKPGTPAAAAAAGGAAAAPFVKAFDELVAEFFAPVEQGAKVCGPDVEKSVAAFKEALAAQRDMLVVASSSRQPFDVNLQKVLKPTSDLMGKVDTLKDRRSKQFNHLAMLAEGVQCLGWVCVEKTPISFLSDTMPGSEMYGNKVVMEFKNTDDAAQADFAKAFKQFLLELQKYVKAHHTTGLAWNPNGGTGYAGSAGGLFAELNALGAAGASATANLKKVQKDQMTHKNPALRASSLVADMSKPAPAAPAGAKAPAAKKAPKFSQNGSKFFIEHYEDDRTLSVTECTNKTAVCMVACKRSLLQIPGKINTLQIDGCVKTSIVVESCVASIDVINCKSCEIQVTDWTPMITLDGCEGAIIYLSQKCVDNDVAIVSSKCSELNIVLPAKSNDEDPVELPVPEQFETRVRNGALVTTHISHVGA
eukprot:CAMPEP_0180132926 /NCGR_PEP_ID=MMETSP0986-20121125/9256_1 /TAXON_ID=697907 /ORGANISM="non described non described, Strain CCMP2293" /LENGTH=433 /DNA_ID=CAMNT_0022072987 /DNA_START=101 /DNA_END=1402 /DNA_ORIENTATION=+